MKLRLFVDIDYADPVTPLAESAIRGQIAQVIHEIAREKKFNAAGHLVITMATAVTKIVPEDDTVDSTEEA